MHAKGPLTFSQEANAFAEHLTQDGENECGLALPGQALHDAWVQDLQEPQDAPPGPLRIHGVPRRGYRERRQMLQATRDEEDEPSGLSLSVYPKASADLDRARIPPKHNAKASLATALDSFENAVNDPPFLSWAQLLSIFHLWSLASDILTTQVVWSWCSSSLGVAALVLLLVHVAVSGACLAIARRGVWAYAAVPLAPLLSAASLTLLHLLPHVRAASLYLRLKRCCAPSSSNSGSDGRSSANGDKCSSSGAKPPRVSSYHDRMNLGDAAAALNARAAAAGAQPTAAAAGAAAGAAAAAAAPPLLSVLLQRPLSHLDAYACVAWLELLLWQHRAAALLVRAALSSLPFAAVQAAAIACSYTSSCTGCEPEGMPLSAGSTRAALIQALAASLVSIVAALLELLWLTPDACAASCEGGGGTAKPGDICTRLRASCCACCGIHDEEAAGGCAGATSPAPSAAALLLRALRCQGGPGALPAEWAQRLQQQLVVIKPEEVLGKLNGLQQWQVLSNLLARTHVAVTNSTKRSGQVPRAYAQAQAAAAQPGGSGPSGSSSSNSAITGAVFVVAGVQALQDLPLLLAQPLAAGGACHAPAACGGGPAPACGACSVQLGANTRTLEVSFQGMFDDPVASRLLAPSLELMLPAGLVQLSLTNMTLHPDCIKVLCSYLGATGHVAGQPTAPAAAAAATATAAVAVAPDDQQRLQLQRQAQASSGAGGGACRLQRLILRDVHLAPGCLSQLCVALSGNASVEVLDLSSNTFDDAVSCGSDLRAMLAGSGSLREVMLSYCALDSEAAFDVLLGAAASPRLTSLDLSQNRIGDLLPPNELLSEAHALVNTSLTNLDLSFNWIGDLMAGWIMAAAEAFPRLQQLRLNHNQSGAGAGGLEEEALMLTMSMSRPASRACMQGLAGHVSWSGSNSLATAAAPVAPTAQQQAAGDRGLELVLHLRHADPGLLEQLHHMQVLDLRGVSLPAWWLDRTKATDDDDDDDGEDTAPNPAAAAAAAAAVAAGDGCSAGGCYSLAPIGLRHDPSQAFTWSEAGHVSTLPPEWSEALSAPGAVLDLNQRKYRSAGRVHMVSALYFFLAHHPRVLITNVSPQGRLTVQQSSGLARGLSRMLTTDEGGWSAQASAQLVKHGGAGIRVPLLSSQDVIRIGPEPGSLWSGVGAGGSTHHGGQHGQQGAQSHRAAAHRRESDSASDSGMFVSYSRHPLTNTALLLGDDQVAAPVAAAAVAAPLSATVSSPLAGVQLHGLGGAAGGLYGPSVSRHSLPLGGTVGGSLHGGGGMASLRTSSCSGHYSARSSAATALPAQRQHAAAAAAALPGAAVVMEADNACTPSASQAGATARSNGAGGRSHHPHLPLHPHFPPHLQPHSHHGLHPLSVSSPGGVELTVGSANTLLRLDSSVADAGAPMRSVFCSVEASMAASEAVHPSGSMAAPRGPPSMIAEQPSCGSGQHHAPGHRARLVIGSFEQGPVLRVPLRWLELPMRAAVRSGVGCATAAAGGACNGCCRAPTAFEFHLQGLPESQELQLDSLLRMVAPPATLPL